MGDGPSMGDLAFRLVGSLLLVVGLLFLIARLVNRRMRPSAGAAVQIVARQQLTRSAGVAVVTVGDRVLVVGTTEHQVSLLAEMEPDELVTAEQLAALDAADLADDAGGPAAGAPAGGTAPAATTVASHRRRLGVVPKHAGQARQAGQMQGALAGSVLSAQTWKQTLAFFTAQGRDPAADGARPVGTAPPDEQRPAS